MGQIFAIVAFECAEVKWACYATAKTLDAGSSSATVGR